MKNLSRRDFLRTSALAGAAAALAGAMPLAASAKTPETEEENCLFKKKPQLVVVPQSSRPRVIVTTDLEVDDLNSVIHTSLYLNEIDLAGIVYSSSQYHFNGDGVHTLGEVTPHYLCRGTRIYEDPTYVAETPWENEPDPAAANLTHYRDLEEGWLERLWDNEYRAAYKYLSQNDANYPTPEYLLSVTKYGNIAFEGDVREATEGSNWIKDAMLDNDPRKLYVLSWGGVNTVVRALMSIAEQYQGTSEWDAIRQKIYNKVVINGTGQDNSWSDNHIPELYPNLVIMSNSNGYAGYGIEEHYSPVPADPTDQWCLQGSTEDVNYTFHGAWLGENIKEGHGALMGKYYLFGDGQEYYEEPMCYQFGLTGKHNPRIRNIPERTYDKYDFIGEGDTSGIIPLFNNGLRGLTENGKYGTWGGVLTYRTAAESPRRSPSTTYNYLAGTLNNAPKRFLLAFQEDWAARADWCVKGYNDCNHAPVVNVKNGEITAKPGQAVTLEGIVSDPDGDEVNTLWWFYPEGSVYSGEATDIRVWNASKLTTGFTVPYDAKEGDFFNIVLQGRDDNASAPMTRYSQVIVKVSG